MTALILIGKAASGRRRQSLLDMGQIAGKNSRPTVPRDLYLVRRSVCCCSAVARGSLPLPSPSLGVSSLDLGRSRKVSGPFSFSFFLFAFLAVADYSAAAR